MDEGKGTRLSALLLPAPRGSPEGCDASGVITAGLPLKPGQRYDLSMALPAEGLRARCGGLGG